MKGPMTRAKKIEDLDPNMQARSPASDGGAVSWRSYRDPAFTVFGLAWYEEDGRVLRRLPARARPKVREAVWDLAQHTSGGRIRFATDSTSLRLRLTQPYVEMINMCPIGHSGLDLYVGAPGEEVYWNSVRPDLAAQRAGKPYETVLFEKAEKKMREITLYLPVYNAVIDLTIGLDDGAVVTPPASYAHDKPIVFYGTSITQSGCASRPGNGYVPILGQMLNTDVVNLGFSGNGLGEPELAELVAEVEASVFVLDYEANAGLEKMAKNLGPFVEIIRKHHPETPILILSKFFFSKIHYMPEGYDGAKRSAACFKKIAAELSAKYRGPVQFVDGWRLIGPDTRYATVDGVHPNDYGFSLMAERLAPVLKRLLQRHAGVGQS